MDTDYIYPVIEFLKHNDNNTATLSDDGDNLVQFLKLMKVSAKVAYVEASSVSSLYAIELAPGVRVSKVTSLKHELSVELKAIDIQFLIPIPGTSYLGIRAIKPDAPEVLLGDYLINDSYLKSRNNLEVVLGRLYDGKPAYFDFRKLNHLLISGTTGSGKSIFIDSIIVNLLYKSSPDELKLILIDTHALNLLRFNNLPHLILPVITDCKKACAALAWLLSEMDYRYQELSYKGVKNIDAYNVMMNEEGQKRMPDILMIVDDLADIMAEAAYANDFQADLDRLSGMARFVGIHLLLSIQRPSSEIVSSTVKMNIPNRIAFSTVSGNDSRLIIQVGGAEHLNGNGDMLFKQLGQQEPLRIQGPYVSDEEIDIVVDFVKRNSGFYTFSKPEVICQNVQKIVIPSDIDNSLDTNDEFLEEAARLIIKKQKASVGMLQREFRIGFNRTAKIMDKLVELGVVGPEEYTKPRRILMNMEEFESMLLERPFT